MSNLILSLTDFMKGARGVKTLDFAGTKEVVYERSDWPLAKLHDYFKNDTLALIGYGAQGHGQGLNARDNGLNVIVGVRKNGESWKQAVADGWVGQLVCLGNFISANKSRLGTGGDPFSH
jgi:hypothetical protein